MTSIVTQNCECPTYFKALLSGEVELDAMVKILLNFQNVIFLWRAFATRDRFRDKDDVIILECYFDTKHILQLALPISCVPACSVYNASLAKTPKYRAMVYISQIMLCMQASHCHCEYDGLIVRYPLDQLFAKRLTKVDQIRMSAA